MSNCSPAALSLVARLRAALKVGVFSLSVLDIGLPVDK
jgi:hypothetical protein